MYVPPPPNYVLPRPILCILGYYVEIIGVGSIYSGYTYGSAEQSTLIHEASLHNDKFGVLFAI
jgi:hypothetical protein